MEDIYSDVIDKMRNNEPIGECLDSVMEITGMDADDRRLAQFMKHGSSFVFDHFFHTDINDLSFNGIVNANSKATETKIKALMFAMVLGYLFGANSAKEFSEEVAKLDAIKAFASKLSVLVELEHILGVESGTLSALFDE